MKNKISSLILVCAMITSLFTFMPTVVSAATEGYYTYTVSNGEATITDVDTSISGDITIPDNVTAIGKGAFAWCNNLTRIENLKGVTTIGDDALAKSDEVILTNEYIRETYQDKIDQTQALMDAMTEEEENDFSAKVIRKVEDEAYEFLMDFFFPEE